MALLQPGGVVDDGRGPGLDAAMIAVDLRGPADLGVGEVLGFLLRGEQRDVLVQRALIALEGQNVVGLLVQDLLRDAALASHGLDGHDGALDRQQVQQLGDGDDLIGLVRHLDLTQHEALTGRKGRHHVKRALALLAKGLARRLAIDGDHLGRGTRELADPAHEAATERFGIERGENVAQLVVRGSSVHKWPEATQEFELLGPKARDLDEAFGPSQNREKTEQQDLIERVSHLPRWRGSGNSLKWSRKTTASPNDPHAAVAIAVLRSPNQRTTTDSACHPVVTHFLRPCASSMISRAMRRAVTVGEAPLPAKAFASQRAVSALTMPVGRSAQTTKSTTAATRNSHQAASPRATSRSSAMRTSPERPSRRCRGGEGVPRQPPRTC